MRTVWKFKINPPTDDSHTIKIEMPLGAEVISVQTRFSDGHPHLWALVDDKLTMVLREFEIFGTGHEIPVDPSERVADRHHLGTFQVKSNGNYLVFHLFEWRIHKGRQ